LLTAVAGRRRRIGDMRRFAPPVRVIFGARDRYMNPRVARNFAALFPHSELHLLDGAGHYAQVDQPERVADLIVSGERSPAGNDGGCPGVPVAGRVSTPGYPAYEKGTHARTATLTGRDVGEAEGAPHRPPQRRSGKWRCG